MRIEQIDADRHQEWDEFVLGHPWACAGHLSAIAELEEHSSGAINRSLALLDSEDRIVGVLPLFEVVSRRMPFVTTRLLTSGTHLRSAPLFAPSTGDGERKKALGALMEHVDRLARSLGVDQVRISYPLISGERTALENYGYYPLKHYGYRENNVVGLLLDLRHPTERLFEQLQPRFRGRLRKCGREGATHSLVETREEWLACHALNMQTLGDECLSPRAFEVVWDRFIAPGFATALALRVEGRLASVVVVVGINGAAYYWFGFNAKPQLSPGANGLALWESIRIWKERGATFFELGSMEFSSEKQRNISRFKQYFGGQPCYGLGGELELKPAKSMFLDFLQHNLSHLRRKTLQIRRPAADTQAADVEALAERVDS